MNTNHIKACLSGVLLTTLSACPPSTTSQPNTVSPDTRVSASPDSNLDTNIADAGTPADSSAPFQLNLTIKGDPSLRGFAIKQANGICLSEIRALKTTLNFEKSFSEEMARKLRSMGLTVNGQHVTWIESIENLDALLQGLTAQVPDLSRGDIEVTTELLNASEQSLGHVKFKVTAQSETQNVMLLLKPVANQDTDTACPILGPELVGASLEGAGGGFVLDVNTPLDAPLSDTEPASDSSASPQIGSSASPQPISSGTPNTLLAPINLLIAARSTNTLTLTWDFAEKTNHTYTLLLDGKVVSTDLTSPNYTFFGLDQETEYTLGVKAVNTKGESAVVTLLGKTTASGKEGIGNFSGGGSSGAASSSNTNADDFSAVATLFLQTSGNEDLSEALTLEIDQDGFTPVNIATGQTSPFSVKGALSAAGSYVATLKRANGKTAGTINITVADDGSITLDKGTEASPLELDLFTSCDGNCIITTIAGDGTGAFGGDGGAATAAQLSGPTGSIALDNAGNIYIPDYTNNRIRKVDADTGIISTIAGDGTGAFGGDGGAATSAQLFGPLGVAVDGSGNIYIVDSLNHRIRKVDVGTGNISTLAGDGTEGFGGDGGAAAAAQLDAPSGIALDSAGNVYFTSFDNNRVRKIDVNTGIISTIAGGGSGLGDGGLATAAELASPQGVFIDNADNVYIADRFQGRIRKVDANTGIISTIAGNGDGFGGDGGVATAALFNRPNGVAIDRAGNLYISDRSNQRIRKVDADTGIISTIAGDGTGAFGGDGGAATAASIRQPQGVFVDDAGNIYITDSGNNRIRKMSQP